MQQQQVLLQEVHYVHQVLRHEPTGGAKRELSENSQESEPSGLEPIMAAREALVNPLVLIPTVVSEAWTDLANDPSDDEFYVMFAQAETGVESEDGQSLTFLQLEGFSKAWFDANPPPPPPESWEFQEEWLNYYAEARLFLLEIQLRPSEEARYPALAGLARSVKAGREPSKWYKVRSRPRTPGGQDDVALRIYSNLFQGGAYLNLADIEPVDADAKRKLDRAVASGHVDDADNAALRRVLGNLTVSSIDSCVVYDVGQGNSIGLCGPSGSVRAYFDLGGGVGPNRKTFPAALKNFCFTDSPPIILSHWDRDHWSSAYIDHRSLVQNWLVPRQRLTPLHANLIADIARARGKVWFLPPTFTRQTVGQVQLEVCAGKSRNNSGIALTVRASSTGADPILLPGDADYRYIPSFSVHTPYLSVVAPHHGALVKSRNLPACPGKAPSRLVYSYGTGNSYSHPHPSTTARHDKSGWHDPRHRAAPPVTRDTSARSAAGLGHVALYWGTIPAAPASPCRGRCNLIGQQT